MVENFTAEAMAQVEITTEGENKRSDFAKRKSEGENKVRVVSEKECV